MVKCYVIMTLSSFSSNKGTNLSDDTATTLIVIVLVAMVVSTFVIFLWIFLHEIGKNDDE